jgi:methyl-accepting chemotaxis protein
MVLDLTTEHLSWVVTAITAIGSGWFFLRKRASATSLAVASDVAKVDVLDMLRNEIRTLRDANTTLTTERNGAMRELGSLGAQVSLFSGLLNDIRAEQKSNAAERAVLVDTTAGIATAVRTELVQRAKALDTTTAEIAAQLKVNTALTQKAANRADEVYEISNNVNDKLEKIGVVMADGKPLNSRDASATAAPDASAIPMTLTGTVTGEVTGQVK